VTGRADGDDTPLDFTKADAALQRAILRFPEMVLMLADKSGASFKPEVSASPYFMAGHLPEGTSNCGGFTVSL
jgi:hypothetical protein